MKVLLHLVTSHGCFYATVPEQVRVWSFKPVQVKARWSNHKSEIGIHGTVVTSQKGFSSWSQKIKFSWKGPSVAGQPQMKACFVLCSLIRIIHLWIPASLPAGNSTKLCWRSTGSNKKTLELILVNVTLARYALYSSQNSDVGPVTVIKIYLKYIGWLSCILYRLC